MSNPRDTQFAGFAALLANDIQNASDVFIDTIDDLWLEKWERVIARRAYDFAKHVLGEVSYDGAPYLDSHVQNISDLTQWPEVSQ